MELLPAEAVQLKGTTALADITPKIKIISIKLWISCEPTLQMGSL